jgi:hypothetical protein
MSRKKFLAIVDPWAVPSRQDRKEFPMLTSDSKIQYQLIYNQLPRLKPLFDDIIVINSWKKSHPIFDELPSVNSVLGEYLDERQDWNAWFCGFHYGRCIHAKIREVVKQYEWQYSRFHIIQNLSFMFPVDQIDALQSWERNIDMKLIKEYYWDYLENFNRL